jgi:(p)ppGpp synthase/HD superfamily hydrolase
LSEDTISATWLTQRFEDALVYANRLHALQTRKGTGIPYLSHLLAVAGLVLENAGDEDEAIAALLHDAVEDQGGQETLSEIRRRFGNRVANIVEECTDADVIPKPPWRARKQAYLAHLRHASASARLVSSADKLHNARAILSDYRELGDDLWKRFNSSKEENLWYYRSLADLFLAMGPSRLAAELDRVVAEMEQMLANQTSTTTAPRWTA